MQSNLKILFSAPWYHSLQCRLTHAEPSITAAPFKWLIFLTCKCILQKPICLFAVRKLNRTEERGTLKFKHWTTVQETFPNNQASLKEAVSSFIPQPITINKFPLDRICLQVCTGILHSHMTPCFSEPCIKEMWYTARSKKARFPSNQRILSNSPCLFILAQVHSKRPLLGLINTSLCI